MSESYHTPYGSPYWAPNTLPAFRGGGGTFEFVFAADGYIDLPIWPLVSQDEYWSFEVEAHDLDATMYICSQASDNGFTLRVNSSDYVRGYQWGSGTGNTVKLVLNTMTRVAMDSDAGDVDASNWWVGASTASFTRGTTSRTGLRIGMKSTGTNGFTGVIRNIIRADNEADFDAGAGSWTNRWKMDEGNNTIIDDIGGQDATLEPGSGVWRARTAAI